MSSPTGDSELSTGQSAASTAETGSETAGNWLTMLWRRDAPTVVWSIIFLLIVVVSLFGPMFLSNPNELNPAVRLQGPSGSHWFGTDDYGRDILSRVVNAGRTSLGTGLTITVIAIFFGTLVGVVAGYYVKTSAVLMRLMDALMAFPLIVIAIALVVSLGSGGLSVIIALGVVLIPHVARIVRSRVLSIKEKGYIAAARAAGVGGPRIILTHVIPNAFNAVLVQVMLVFATALLADGALSFLGLGLQPPTATWGNMIGDARTFITVSPTFIIIPGLMIVIAVMALNMIGDGIRGIFDPHARAILELERTRKIRSTRERRARRSARDKTVTGPDMP